MHKALRIARREYGAQVRTKGFLIGLALAPVLACGGLVVFLLMKDRVDTETRHLGVVDRSGLVADYLVAEAERRNTDHIFDAERNQVRPAYLLEIIPPDDTAPDDQRLRLSDRVRKRELYAFLEIGPDVLHPEAESAQARVAYYSDNPLIQDLRSWLARGLNNRLPELRAEESAFSFEEVVRVTRRINVESLGLVKVDRQTGAVQDARHTSEIEAVFVPMGMMMVLFFMMMFGTMPLLGSVLEEKTRKISELLLGSVSPFTMMAGKLLGGVAVSLTSLSFYVIIGVVVAQYTGVSDQVPFHLLPWLIVFLVAAILMFGALLSALGAACNEQSEAQALMPFVMIPMVIPMMTWFPVAREPLGTFATGMSLFPPFTPVLMMLRMATPAGVPGWQPWVGLAGVILATIFCVWAGGRVFRVGILMQGQPPRIGTLLRWVFRG